MNRAFRRIVRGRPTRPTLFTGPLPKRGWRSSCAGSAIPMQGLTPRCAPRSNEARHRSDVRDIFWCLLRHVELLSFLGELSKVETLLPELTGTTREHEFPFYRARVRIMEGDVLACRGDPERGAAWSPRVSRAGPRQGQRCTPPWYSALLAETHRMLGDTEAALRILREALDLAERTGEMWYAAELHRRMGEVHRQRGDDDAAAVCFARALAVADRQNAMLWKLQAAASNARLLRDQGSPRGGPRAARPGPCVVHRRPWHARCCSDARSSAGGAGERRRTARSAATA